MVLAAEDRLLLACGRNRTRVEDLDCAREAIAEGLDWDYVLEASVRHAVAPMLHRGLDKLLRAHPELTEKVPTNVALRLHQLHDGNARRAERLYSVLGDVVSSFRSQHVEVLGLKDVQLAVEVYDDRALRPMGDVDLLVRRDDWRAATDSLRGLGFVPVGDGGRFVAKYAPGEQFRRPADETWIDLQWHVAELGWDRHGDGRFTFDTGRLWPRAVPLPIDGYELLAPCPVDMLLHLCLHLEGHAYCELVLFSDIVALLEQYNGTLDWDDFVGLVDASGAASATYHVLLLTELMFGVSPPTGVLDALRPSYFRGPLSEPLFSNLTSLHWALDDVERMGRPAPSVVRDLEVRVREQAAAAMHLEGELDDIAEEFVSSGARVIVFDGDASPRRFPDPAVPAFGAMEAFVLADDEPCFRDVLRDRGFAPSSSEAFSKDWPVLSRDPVLQGRFSTVELAVRISHDARAAISTGEVSGLSNRDAAIHSLRGRLRGRKDLQTRAHLTVHALSASELLLALAVRLERRPSGHLFQLCGLLDALASKLEVAGADIARLASVHGVVRETASGLAITSGFLPRDEVVAALGTALPLTTPPRLFTWARYDASSLERYPELRAAYLFLLCLLMHEGAMARLRVLLGALNPPRGHIGLSTIVARAFRGALRRRTGGRPSADQFAYWLE